MKKKSIILIGDKRFNTVIYLKLYPNEYTIIEAESIEHAKTILEASDEEIVYLLIYSNDLNTDVIKFVNEYSTNSSLCHTIIINDHTYYIQMFETFDTRKCTIMENPVNLDRLVETIHNILTTEEGDQCSRT